MKTRFYTLRDLFMSFFYLTLTQPMNKQEIYSQHGEYVLDVQLCLWKRIKIISSISQLLYEMMRLEIGLRLVSVSYSKAKPITDMTVQCDMQMAFKQSPLCYLLSIKTFQFKCFALNSTVSESESLRSRCTFHRFGNI